MKKVIALLAVALLVPSVALAKGNPGTHGGKGKGHAPKVTYVLKGTLSGYTAYDASSSTNGSITIAVSRANYHGKALKGQTLTFPVDGKTKITLDKGVTAISDGDRGIVKVRAAKKIAAADLASTLQASSASHVIDQGAPSSH